MKERLVEFLAYLGIGQNKFEKSTGLSIGFVSKFSGNITMNSLDKISQAYPELNINWLKTGEGNMLKPATIQKIGTINANSGVVAQVGGDFHNNTGKDRIIETLEQKDGQLVHTFTDAVHRFHDLITNRDEYITRQDDEIKRLANRLDDIVKHSYLRNQANMERIDRVLDQHNTLIGQVIQQSNKMQERADRLLDLLEKKM